MRWRQLQPQQKRGGAGQARGRWGKSALFWGTFLFVLGSTEQCGPSSPCRGQGRRCQCWTRRPGRDGDQRRRWRPGRHGSWDGRHHRPAIGSGGSEARGKVAVQHTHANGGKDCMQFFRPWLSCSALRASHPQAPRAPLRTLDIAADRDKGAGGWEGEHKQGAKRRAGGRRSTKWLPGCLRMHGLWGVWIRAFCRVIHGPNNSPPSNSTREKKRETARVSARWLLWRAPCVCISDCARCARCGGRAGRGLRWGEVGSCNCSLGLGWGLGRFFMACPIAPMFSLWSCTCLGCGACGRRPSTRRQP
jgi:hypothetical protein